MGGGFSGGYFLTGELSNHVSELGVRLIGGEFATDGIPSLGHVLRGVLDEGALFVIDAEANLRLASLDGAGVLHDDVVRVRVRHGGLADPAVATVLDASEGLLRELSPCGRSHVRLRPSDDARVDRELLACGREFTEAVESEVADGLIDITQDLLVRSRMDEHQVLAVVDAEAETNGVTHGFSALDVRRVPSQTSHDHSRRLHVRRHHGAVVLRVDVARSHEVRGVSVHGVPVLSVRREEFTETIRRQSLAVGGDDDVAFLVVQTLVPDVEQVPLSRLHVEADDADSRDFARELLATRHHVGHAEDEAKREELLLLGDRATRVTRDDEAFLGSDTLLAGADVDVPTAQDVVRVPGGGGFHHGDEVVADVRREVRGVLDGVDIGFGRLARDDGVIALGLDLKAGLPRLNCGDGLADSLVDLLGHLTDFLRGLDGRSASVFGAVDEVP